MEVKLKRDGWHRKIQEYVFTNPPTFNNLCPYFWLTNFCILVTFIIPIVPLWRLLCFVGRGIDKAFDATSNFVDSKICEPILIRKSLELSDDDRLRGWSIWGYYNYEDHQSLNDASFFKYDYFEDKVPGDMRQKEREEYRKKFEVWKERTPDWKEQIAKLRADRMATYVQLEKERERLREERIHQESLDREAQQKAKARRQAMFTNIVKYTKWLGYIALTALALFVGHLLYRLIKYAIAHFHYGNFIYVMKCIAVFIVIIAVCLFIIWFFKNVLYRAVSCAVDSKIFGGFIKAIVWICKKTIVPVGSKIIDFLEFFWEYLKVAKKDYCPGINWEEKDTK